MDSVLTLFDFDGTITRKDTLIHLIRFSTSTIRFIAGFLWLTPVLVEYKLGQRTNTSAKESVLAFFFGGLTQQRFQKMCDEFCETRLPKLMRKTALLEIEAHKAAGHSIYVVSASCENWIKPWADMMGISVISSRLEVTDGILTGRLLGANCYGKEKINRIKEAISFETFRTVFAYGDSNGDSEMLALASHAYKKQFPFHLKQ